jgi:hypothetical protein
MALSPAMKGLLKSKAKLMQKLLLLKQQLPSGDDDTGQATKAKGNFN